ncbi:hypothetical protein [Ferruginibacter sp.]|nr:hypothetical protein [Ferruginibacter sp.]
MNKLQKMLVKMRSTEQYRNIVFAERLSRITQPDLNINSNKSVINFKHSGNAGDIIYSLPALITLSEGKKANLYLRTNQPGNYGKNPHPLGSLMLNDKIVEMLQPLLQQQDYINDCSVFSGTETIDFDLDKVRDYPWSFSRGDLARLYFMVFNAHYDLQKPWLHVVPDNNFNNSIVLARSQRYNAPGIDYSFLKKYSNIYFVGVETEYQLMKAQIPKLQFIKVKNFLEMASVIAGSKLFIGNQSFPFSLAEAQKTNRLLEVYFQCPNVITTGNNGYDFCFQPQFEKLVKDRYENLQG